MIMKWLNQALTADVQDELGLRLKLGLELGIGLRLGLGQCMITKQLKFSLAMFKVN